LNLSDGFDFDCPKTKPTQIRIRNIAEIWRKDTFVILLDLLKMITIEAQKITRITPEEFRYGFLKFR
jgi:hypothetical protein